MTSKNSFFNIMKEDQKRRIWTIVVFALLCFMLTAAYELNIEMCELNCVSNGMTLEESLMQLTKSGMITAYLFFSGIAAILFGFQGFGWLTKNEQVDFYHSQPMKREKRFAVIYINSVLFFEISMFLHLAVTALLIGARGCLNKTMIENIVRNGAVFTISFLLLFSLVILAVMLTGNIIVSFMAAGTFFFYFSAVKYLIQGYFMTFFDTYSSQYSNPVGFLSSISACEKLAGLARVVYRGDERQLMINALSILVMAAVLLVLAFFLYKKRPSECAGNALAFPFTGNVIRVLMVIPAAMLFGILFSASSGMNQVFWLYFGTVAGVILTHGFMEVVFHFDIKAALNKKLQLVGSMLLAVFMVSVFQFDLSGYDSYIPEEKEVREVSYYIDMTEYNTDLVTILDENGVPLSVSQKEGYLDDCEMTAESWQLQTTATKDVAPVLAVVKAHMKNKPGKEDSTKRFLVCYKLKSGKKEYRQYEMDVEVLKKSYSTIYDTQQGKEAFHPYLKLSGEKVCSVTAYTPYMGAETPLDLTERETKELLECYKKDVNARDFLQFLEDKILGTVTFAYASSIDSGRIIEIPLYVSSNYENMLHFLEKKGVFLHIPNDNYIIEEIVADNPLNEEETKNHAFWKGRIQVKLNNQQAEEVLPLLILDEYMYSNDWTEYTYYFEVTVTNRKTGTKRQVYYHIREKDVPAYMKIK